MLVLIIVLALGWAGYWVFGAQALKGAWSQWFADRTENGWVAEVDELKVAGFPNRFDVTFDGLDLADPRSGLAWSAPFFQIFALSYRPNHVIAVWPHEQTIAIPGQRVSVDSGDMRASLVLGDKTSLPLERMNFVTETPVLTSDAGWQSAAETVNVALHRQEPAQSTYRLAVTATGYTPPAFLREASSTALPHSLSSLELDMTTTFNAPWDRFAVERARPQPTRINLDKAQATWGELHLAAAGTVDVDASGYPVGEVTVRLTNWREMVALARASGQVPEGVMDGVEKGLELLAGLSGNSQTLDVPLTFKNGRIWIAIVPLGAAPRLILH
nr:DUF2125 domain-containing protein [Shimia biformata]